MKIYEGSTNMSNVAIATALNSLVLRIKKTTAVASLGKFLEGDTIGIILNSQGRQETIIASLPLLAVGYYSTLHNGFIKASQVSSSDTKITEVTLRVDLGCGGSIDLSDNKQLLVTTNISGLSAGSDALTCTAVCTGQFADDKGNIIPIAINCFDYVNVEPGTQKDLDVSAASAVIMTPAEKSVTLHDRSGNSFVQNIEALRAVSAAVNEIAVTYGVTRASDSYDISGKTIAANNKVFQAEAVEPGGERYIGFGLQPFVKLKITPKDQDGVILVTPKIFQ